MLEDIVEGIGVLNVKGRSSIIALAIGIVGEQPDRALGWGKRTSICRAPIFEGKSVVVSRANGRADEIADQPFRMDQGLITIFMGR